YYAPGIPAVYTALRGMCYAEIVVRTLDRDLHSGSYGGVAPNAIETLARMLSELKDETGQIRIPKLYKDVESPPTSELKAWKKLPFDKRSYVQHEVGAKALTRLKSYTVFARNCALQTFELHGIRGCFPGDGAKTVIPAQALAKVSLRLVPGQTLEKGQRAVAPPLPRGRPP